MVDPSELSLLTQVTVFHNKRAFDQLVVKYQSFTTSGPSTNLL